MLRYGEIEKVHRWGLIGKVYVIVAAQIVITMIVSSLTLLHSPINELLRGISGIFLHFFGCLPLLLLWPICIYHQKHPFNFLFLGLFAAFVIIVVEVECANTKGEVILETIILTPTVVSTLTCYTFWASRKGKDFSYLAPILYSSLIILLLLYLLSLILQMFFFPSLGPTSVAGIHINGSLGAMVFSGYIVYYIDTLIKRCTSDQYVWAFTLLCWDVVYLSFSILRVLRGLY